MPDHVQDEAGSPATGSVGSGPSRGLTVRRSRPGDTEALVELMTATRVHFAGARHRSVYRAIVADAAGGPSRIVIEVAEQRDRLVAAFVAVRGDERRYWQTLPLRHPRAAAAIAAHRARKLGSRLGRRRRYRQAYTRPVEQLATPESVPPELAARINRRPPTSGSPRPGEHGPHIAYGLYMTVDPPVRGQGVSTAVYRKLFEELRRAGAERYDCSFSLADPAAIAMHCHFPFTVYRLPGGYWGSLDLRIPDRDRSP